MQCFIALLLALALFFTSVRSHVVIRQTSVQPFQEPGGGGLQPGPDSNDIEVLDPNSSQGSTPPAPEIIYLVDGENFRYVSMDFDFENPIPEVLSDAMIRNRYNETITRSFDSLPGTNPKAIISDEVYTYSPSDDPSILLVNLKANFRGLTGEASIKYSMTDPATGVLIEYHYKFIVVGIALYTTGEPLPNLLSGRQGQEIILPDSFDNDELEPFPYIVNATVCGGPDDIVNSLDVAPLHEDAIQFQILSGPSNSDQSDNDNSLHQFPWNPEICSRTVSNFEDLSDDCSFAFSTDLSAFAIRINPRDPIQRRLRLEFLWKGLKNHSELSEPEVGVQTDPQDNDETPKVESDELTFALLTADGISTRGSSLAGWKIAVISATTILLFVASVVLLICCCGWRQKKKRRRWGIQAAWGARTNTERLGNKDGLPAELASSGSTLVMMGEGGKPIVPNNVDDSSGTAARLVWSGVGRGVDLEPSTAGGSCKFPLSDEVYAARAVDSDLFGGPPEGAMFDADTGEGALEDEKKGREEADKGVDDLGKRFRCVRKGEEENDKGESELTGVETMVERSGVGAAINRVRQVDLLHGPASKELMRKKALEAKGGGIDEGGGVGEGLSVSTVS